MIKEIVTNIFSKKAYSKMRTLYRRYVPINYSVKVYGQEAEDLIADKILGYKRSGFYVDIGAHHPERFSNTYILYKRGWSGINIDAMPGSMLLFKKKRKRDINLEIPISDKQEELSFFIFDEPALNTFSYNLANEYKKSGYLLVSEKRILAKPLAVVLDAYMPADKKIDFMSIDVEGFDLQVLKSNNWDKYTPKVILIEEHDFDVEHPRNSPIYTFLKNRGYSLVAKTINTLIFKH